MLKLKDDKHFKGFCEALEATEQNSAVMDCFLGHCVRDSHLYLLSITLVIPTCCSYYVPAHIAGTLSAAARLTSVCLTRISCLRREQRRLGKLKLPQR